MYYYLKNKIKIRCNKGSYYIGEIQVAKRMILDHKSLTWLVYRVIMLVTRPTFDTKILIQHLQNIKS